MKRLSILLCLTLALGNFSTPVQAQSNTKLYKKSIEVGKSKDINTDIHFFAGELNIKASSTDLAECFYGYENGFLKPDMTYSEIDKTGYLSIQSQESDKKIDIGNDNNNKWNLFLNKKLKNAVSIKLTAGKANINLEGANLSRFYYRMTAGESTINLKNTSVPQIDFHLMAGKANLDLSGEWKNDMVASIKGGVGEVTIKVPYHTGVRIEATGVLGEIHIPFFKQDDNIYTNDQYQKTKNTLFINISGGIGQIVVQMVE